MIKPIQLIGIDIDYTTHLLLSELLHAVTFGNKSVTINIMEFAKKYNISRSVITHKNSSVADEISEIKIDDKFIVKTAYRRGSLTITPEPVLVDLIGKIKNKQKGVRYAILSINDYKTLSVAKDRFVFSLYEFLVLNSYTKEFDVSPKDLREILFTSAFFGKLLDKFLDKNISHLSKTIKLEGVSFKKGKNFIFFFKVRQYEKKETSKQKEPFKQTLKQKEPEKEVVYEVAQSVEINPLPDDHIIHGIIERDYKENGAKLVSNELIDECKLRLNYDLLELKNQNWEHQLTVIRNLYKKYYNTKEFETVTKIISCYSRSKYKGMGW